MLRLAMIGCGTMSGAHLREMEDPENSPRSRVIHSRGTSRKHTAAEMEHFLDCIETRSQPETDLRSGLQSLRAIWGLYDAEQRGIVADLSGLGLDQFSAEPDRVLAERRKFGYTCDRQKLFG
jgi:hypothetical protein